MLKGYAAKVAEIPAFAGLGSSFRSRLAELVTSISQPRVMKPNEVLYAEGADDESTGAVLIEGTLSVSTQGGPTLSVAAPDLLGEMQQFDKFGQRTATVKAVSDATVLEFRWHEFVARIRDTPAISKEDQNALRKALESYANSRLHQL